MTCHPCPLDAPDPACCAATAAVRAWLKARLVSLGAAVPQIEPTRPMQGVAAIGHVPQPAKREMRKCSECGDKHYGKGLCRKHWYRQYGREWMRRKREGK